MDDRPSTLRPAFERMLDAGHELSDAEVLAAYVDGVLDDERRDRLELALADDATLRAEVQALRDVRAEMQASGTLRGDGPAQVLPFTPRLARPAPPTWAMAAVLVVGLGLGITAYRFLESRGGPLQTADGAVGQRSVPAPPGGLAPAEVPGPGQGDAAAQGASEGALAGREPRVSLRDGDGMFGIAADGSGTGIASSVTPDVLMQVADAVRDGRLPLPTSFADVESRAGTLMGASDAGPQPTPAAPRATFVRGPRPTFTWQSMPDATSYRVVVVDASLDVVADSGDVSEARWTPARALPRNVVLTWQVTAQTPGGAVTAPQPPAAEARFKVLPVADAAALDADLQRCGASRVARALVLARAGLLDETRVLLATIASQNPDSRAAESWLRQIGRGQTQRQGH